MQTNESGTTGFNDGVRFLLTRTLEINLMCYLFLAGTALPEDDCIGVGRGDGLYLLLNLLPCIAFARQQLIVKRKHYVFRFGILTDRFHQLLVNGRTLDYIRRTTATHHVNGIHVSKIIHYGYNGEAKAFRL